MTDIATVTQILNPVKPLKLNSPRAESSHQLLHTQPEPHLLLKKITWMVMALRSKPPPMLADMCAGMWIKKSWLPC